jgi:hypothetical protein
MSEIELHEEVIELKSDIDDLSTKVDALADQLEDLKNWLVAAFSGLDVTVTEEHK